MVRRAARVTVLLTAAAILVSLPARAQTNQGEAFKARLLAALASGDARQIAGLVSYPIRVSHGMLSHPIPVNNAGEMIQMHRLFFTPELRCRIEQSQAPRNGQPKPRYSMLIANNVVTLADGLVVAQQTPRGYRITRLSVIGQPTNPNARPRDVLFRWGEGETQFAGRLGSDSVDGYVVTAKKGALLQARIERFPGRSLQMRVTDQAGNVIKGAHTEFSRLWAARVPSDGRYRLDVVRRGGSCDEAVTYLLTVGLRS